MKTYVAADGTRWIIREDNPNTNEGVAVVQQILGLEEGHPYLGRTTAMVRSQLKLEENSDVVPTIPTGYTLPNGAIVMLESDGIILARIQGKDFDEFVTWRWDGKDPSSTFWGHYFRSLSRACGDFEERVKEVRANGES